MSHFMSTIDIRPQLTLFNITYNYDMLMIKSQEIKIIINMAKYNLYKIDKSRETNLIDKLQFVGLSKVGEKTIEDFTLSF